MDTLSGAYPKPGYPKTLPSGQQVHWEMYKNGTHVIRLAANGAPPFSPDSVLNILYFLNGDGFSDFLWDCNSLELNVDDKEIRIDASYTFEAMEGILLKAYQHGCNTRFEIADRRKVPIREVLDLVHAISGNLDGTEALRRVEELERKQQQTDETARRAFSIATKARGKAGS